MKHSRCHIWWPLTKSFIGSNWIKPIETRSGGWSFGFDKMHVATNDIHSSGLRVSSSRRLLQVTLPDTVIVSQALLDPGYNVIIVPPSVASEFYSKVKDASQDSSVVQRWVSWSMCAETTETR
jgi:hypothetical protein